MTETSFLIFVAAAVLASCSTRKRRLTQRPQDDVRAGAFVPRVAVFDVPHVMKPSSRTLKPPTAFHSPMTPQLRVACILLCAGEAVAGAEALQAENLLFSPPAEFKVGYHSEQGPQTLTEFVPQAQTVDDWTEMVTVQVFRGMSVSTAGFLQSVGGHYVAACPGTTSKGIMSGKTNGYAVSMLVLNCPNNPSTGKPETTAFRVIKGSDAVYSVQHAWRSTVPDVYMAKFMQDLGTATVCDTRASDHPCPTLEPASR